MAYWGWGRKYEAIRMPSLVHKLKTLKGNVDLDNEVSGFSSSCLFPPRKYDSTIVHLPWELSGANLFFFLFFLRHLKEVSLVSFPLYSHGLLVTSHLFVTAERCSKFFQKHLMPLWRVSVIKVRACFGLNLWYGTSLFKGWAQGRHGQVISLDELILRKWRHDSESEVIAVKVNKETETYEFSVCFWTLARPLGEAQEESRERKHKVQASSLCAHSFPKCLKTMSRNALPKLNQLLATFMFIASQGHHR